MSFPTAGSSSGNSAYDTLPVSIKCRFTLKEYLWLSDAEKARLVNDECEQETYE